MSARAVVGVRVWDGVAAETSSERMSIRIEGERIAAIGAAPELLEGAQRIEPGIEPGADAVALPGLIDAHVHLTLDPGIGSPADQLRVEPEQVHERMRERALAMLRAGITTARDLGGGEWLELALRDRIERGEIPGPRLLCAGQPLTVRGGHCHFWGGIAESPEEIRETVARQVERGANWIKVMATGGVITQGSSVRDAQYTQPELEQVRAEAERHGRRVAAHCHGTAGIRNATGAHLRTLEHCSFAGENGFGSDFDASLCAEIAAREIWVSPTVNAGWQRFLRGGDGRPTRFLEDMRAVFRGLREAGVPLIASTDAGIPNVAHHDLPRGLEVMAEFAELTPVEALRAATSESARALELEDTTGRLQPGLAADLMVVRGDPLADLGALRHPLLVMARGSTRHHETPAVTTSSMTSTTSPER